MTVIDRSRLFTALRVETDSERLVSILKRKQDTQATTETLAEIRRLKRDTAKRRAGIDGLLVKINAAHLNRQAPDDLGHLRPSDTQGEGA